MESKREGSRHSSESRHDHRRDRSHRKHHSSRQHSHRRSRSPSNSRNRRRERRSRSRSSGHYRFDSPPKTYIEYTKKLWDDVKYNSPEEFMARIQQVASTMPSSQANKIDRELYIGNLPSGITNQQLIDLLNTTIQKMNLSSNVSSI